MHGAAFCSRLLILRNPLWRAPHFPNLQASLVSGFSTAQRTWIPGKDFGRVHNVLPRWHPISFRNMVLLSIMLSVAPISQAAESGYNLLKTGLLLRNFKY